MGVSWFFVEASPDLSAMTTSPKNNPINTKTPPGKEKLTLADDLTNGHQPL
jgi:hypothetical protein